MDRLPQLLAARRRNAALYDKLLAGIVDTPSVSAASEDVFYTYTIRADRRDELKKYLEAHDVETKIQHPYLMPEQPAYKEHARGEFLRAKALQQRFLCLPIHEKLTEQHIKYVVTSVRQFYGKS
jgi:dTDP-4-amino-4,6-dideoxygalactose transaminase